MVLAVSSHSYCPSAALVVVVPALVLAVPETYGRSKSDGHQHTRRQILGGRSVRDLAMIDAFLERLDEFACGAEDLQLVVFGGGEHDPGVVFVPVEVGDGVCEAAVHEESVSSLAEDRN